MKTSKVFGLKGKMNFGKTDKRLSHKELLGMIGEIDGIRLFIREGVSYVYLEIHGREIELIRDASVFGDHHITRIGISEAISTVLNLNQKKK